MRRFITIGRHAYTPAQARLLSIAGLGPEVGRIAHLRDPREAVEMASQKGAQAIVVQALPLPLLAQLLSLARRAGVEVYGFRVEAVGLYPTREAAEEAASRLGADIVSPSREGSWRVARTAALQRLKRIVVEAEDVAVLPSTGSPGGQE